MGTGATEEKFSPAALAELHIRCESRSEKLLFIKFFLRVTGAARQRRAAFTLRHKNPFSHFPSSTFAHTYFLCLHRSARPWSRGAGASVCVARPREVAAPVRPPTPGVRGSSEVIRYSDRAAGIFSRRQRTNNEAGKTKGDNKGTRKDGRGESETTWMLLTGGSCV